MLREPAGRQRLTLWSSSALRPRRRDRLPADESAVDRGSARLRRRRTTPCTATRSLAWLEEWFADLKDPASKARPSEMGGPVPMTSLRDVEAQRPDPRGVKADEMTILGSAAAAARSCAPSCPSRRPTSAVTSTGSRSGRRPSPIEVDPSWCADRLLREIGAWSSPRQGQRHGRRTAAQGAASRSSNSSAHGRHRRAVPRGLAVSGLQAHREEVRQEGPCRCGQRTWGQLHFVGVHECGAVAEPWIRRCPQHDDVKLVSPEERQGRGHPLRLPGCNTRDHEGLGYNRRKCACGDGPCGGTFTRPGWSTFPAAWC